MNSKNRHNKKITAEVPLYRAPHYGHLNQLCNSPPLAEQASSDKKDKNNGERKPKLLGSKSLSLLIPRGLFFKSKQSTTAEGDDQQQEQQRRQLPPLPSSRSLPNCPTIVNSTAIDLAADCNRELACKVRRRSLLSRNSSKSSLEQPNVSPIAGLCGAQRTVEGFSMSRLEPDCLQKAPDEKLSSNSKQADENASQPKQRKFKPFKNTSLALRDVKNSLALRMRAKHESFAFCKLTEMVATPPTKLYSPFNIYLDSAAKQAKRKQQLAGQLNNSMEMDYNLEEGDENDIVIVSQEQEFGETPAKRRIALQHKRHLMQANKFTFDSPTGRLRETVRDVEHFQQCIEDISKAIRARDRSPADDC